jgi:hypothetical protein
LEPRTSTPDVISAKDQRPRSRSLMRAALPRRFRM